MASHNNTAAPEAAGVLDDYQDPNHPHYPGNLEHQSFTRRKLLNKKCLLIAGTIITTTLIVVAGIIWGVALTRDDEDKGVKDPGTTTAASISSTTSLEIQTIYETDTTFVYSTTRVPLLIAPSLATSTIILVPTARAQVTPEAPLRPVLTEGIPPMTLEAPAPSDARLGSTSPTKCLFDGAWVLKKQCEEHCGKREGHERHCEVSKRSQWVCVSCPN